MKAMVLRELCDLGARPDPLSYETLPNPEPGPGELLLEVSACGVCHTELDEIEGRTPPPDLPVIPGHQVIGRVVECGRETSGFDVGDRVGVAWIYHACGKCKFCRDGAENLCREFRATGRDADGGYAEYMTVPGPFAHRVPSELTDERAAPLLCAGAIGYRSLRLAGIEDGKRLGLTGFGASAHLVLQMARYRFPRSDVYVFARNPDEREFAKELGAVWAGDTGDRSPEGLDAIIDTTPVWKPVVEALQNLDPGGRLVINAIRKEEVDQEYLLRLDYAEHLWLEKDIKSVANVTRRDVRECLKLGAEMRIAPEIQEYELKEANRALMEVKESKIRGAKVLRMA